MLPLKGVVELVSGELFVRLVGGDDINDGIVQPMVQEHLRLPLQLKVDLVLVVQSDAVGSAKANATTQFAIFVKHESGDRNGTSLGEPANEHLFVVTVQVLDLALDKICHNPDRVPDLVLADQLSGLVDSHRARPIHRQNVIPASHAHASIASHGTNRRSWDNDLASRWDDAMSRIGEHIAEPVG